MNRRHVWALIAASVVLAGCGGGGGVAATAPAATTAGPAVSSGPVPSSSTAATTTSAATSAGAGSGASPEPSAPATGSTAEPTSTVIPAELDSQSAAWFEAVCAEMDVLPTGQGDLPPQAVIDYVKNVSAAMISTSQIATTLPPPTVDGGTELAKALSDSMSSAGTDLAAQVDSILKDFEGANPYSMKSALDANQVMLRVAFIPLTSMDPAVNRALHQFPACQTYGF